MKDRLSPLMKIMIGKLSMLCLEKYIKFTHIFSLHICLILYIFRYMFGIKIVLEIEIFENIRLMLYLIIL